MKRPKTQDEQVVEFIERWLAEREKLRSKWRTKLAAYRRNHGKRYPSILKLLLEQGVKKEAHWNHEVAMLKEIRKRVLA